MIRPKTVLVELMTPALYGQIRVRVASTAKNYYVRTNQFVLNLVDMNKCVLIRFEDVLSRVTHACCPVVEMNNLWEKRVRVL